MISIINYGLGNINAFINVYNTLNVKVKVIDNYKEIPLADKIVLPGVGAFDKAMSLLEKKSFVEPLKNAVLVKKTPILGICGELVMVTGAGGQQAIVLVPHALIAITT